LLVKACYPDLSVWSSWDVATAQGTRYVGQFLAWSSRPWWHLKWNSGRGCM